MFSRTNLKSPVVVLTFESFQKIQNFTNFCQYEINGFGYVETENNVFTITDVFILNQFSSDNGIHVQTDDQALNDHIYNLISNDKDEIAEKMKFQWHSHVNLPAYFSSEDVDTIGKYMNDYMISLVLNKRNQISCRLDIFNPVRISIETPVFIQIPMFANQQYLFDHCTKEIDSKVHIVKESALFLDKKSSLFLPDLADVYYVKAENFIIEKDELLWTFADKQEY